MEDHEQRALQRYERALVRERKAKERKEQKRERMKNIFLFLVSLVLAIAGGVVAYLLSKGGLVWTGIGAIIGWVLLPLMVGFFHLRF